MAAFMQSGSTPAGAAAPRPTASVVASAEPPPPDSSGSLPAPPGFRLSASHGYRVHVLAFDGRGEHPDALLVVVARKGSSVIYSVNSGVTVTETSISADLGTVGMIDVHFVPSGRPRFEHSSCGRRPIGFDSGSYEGRIEIDGEEGFTEAHAGRARGEVRWLASLVCGGGVDEGVGGHSPGARLTAHRRLGRERVELAAMKNSPTRPTRLQASIEERRGPLEIGRSVSTVAGPGSFEFDVTRQVATLSPPAPFRGTARFTRTDRRQPGHLRGSLTVDFPGRAGVPIAGRRARAGLERAVLNPGHPFRTQR